ncbi:hypothetical protein D3C81_1821060 [compost metagenome]
MLNAVIIELLCHAVWPTFHASAATRAVVFISRSYGGTGAEKKCTGDQQREFRVAHNDFLISFLLIVFYDEKFYPFNDRVID